jgi:hypothetical protein
MSAQSYKSHWFWGFYSADVYMYLPAVFVLFKTLLKEGFPFPVQCFVYWKLYERTAWQWGAVIACHDDGLPHLLFKLSFTLNCIALCTNSLLDSAIVSQGITHLTVNRVFLGVIENAKWFPGHPVVSTCGFVYHATSFRGHQFTSLDSNETMASSGSEDKHIQLNRQVTFTSRLYTGRVNAVSLQS